MTAKNLTAKTSTIVAMFRITFEGGPELRKLVRQMEEANREVVRRGVADAADRSVGLVRSAVGRRTGRTGRSLYARVSRNPRKIEAYVFGGHGALNPAVQERVGRRVSSIGAAAAGDVMNSMGKFWRRPFRVR